MNADVLVLQLAKAGFFYRPAPDSLDNVQCFHCEIKLDGWEPEDDPLQEHLAHSDSCNWAQAVSAGVSAKLAGPAASIDPMNEDVIAARRGTFENGSGWPHEGKRGWKCKIQRMAEAGWCFDPAPVTSGEEEEGDGVTCFYCALSLDGWEPKDDPLQEHKKRRPNCVFFALGGGVVKKGRAGGKKGTRGSTASKASRLSTQSTLSEPHSVADDIDQDATMGADASIVSTATTASQATVTGGKKGAKKGSKAKVAAKGVRGRKRPGTMDSQQADDERLYPDLGSQLQNATDQDESIPAAGPPKQRGRGSASKQALDSSVVEISSLDAAPPKKATRGRKAKAQPEPEAESKAEDVSAQIQEELEHSLDLAAQYLDQSTPQAIAPKPKRGTKRTSDGLRKKQQDESDVSAMAVEFPVPPKAVPAPKAKRGRNPSKHAQTEDGEDESQSQQVQSTQEEDSMPEAEPTKAAKPKKAAAKGGRGSRTRKASSTRSSSRTRGSKITRTVDPDDSANEQPEDLDRDEREIEAELARMAAEQATATQIATGMADIQTEQEKSAEYEVSPSHHHRDKHVQAIEHLEQELQAEVDNMSRPGENLTAYVKNVTKPSMSSMPGAFSPPPLSPPTAAEASPSGSDKENVPSSALQQTRSAMKQQHQQQPPAPILSPTKTVRVPLAPSTPNKNPLSPSKRNIMLSPSKAPLGPLTSATPWIPADLDALLMASPQPTPGTLANRLVATAGKLTSPEKGLTVEEWVRWNAEQAEEELRRKCEGMVAVFEGEGNRAMGVLGGLEVVS